MSNNTDLSGLVTKAVEKLGETDGSSIKVIENYVQQSNNFKISPNSALL